MSGKGSKPAAEPRPAPKADKAQQGGKGASAPLPAAVRFAYREATLDEAAQKVLAQVVAALKGGVGKVEVTGYSDRKGSPERQRRIAAERAKAVRDALVTGGVAPDRVTLKPPAQVVGSGSDDEARRVEIVAVAG